MKQKNKVRLSKFIWVVFLALIIFAPNLYSYTPRYYFNHQNMPIELREMAFRAENLVFIEKDLDTIEKYTKELLNSKQLPKYEFLGYQVSFFEKVVRNLQIPEKQLTALQNYAIALKGYGNEKLDKRLSRIIWWTEVRLIYDENKLLEFMNQQIYSSRQKDVLGFYAEKGMTNELIYWSNNLKRNIIEDEFKVAIRKSEFINLLKSKPQNLSKLVIKELRRSVYDGMSPFNRSRTYKHDYLAWLFHQLGVFRQNLKINQTLKKIVKDETFLYIKKVKLLPVDVQEGFIKRLKSNLRLTDKALQALAPNERVKKSHHEY